MFSAFSAVKVLKALPKLLTAEARRGFAEVAEKALLSRYNDAP
jgi:hypothetical protein